MRWEKEDLDFEPLVDCWHCLVHESQDGHPPGPGRRADLGAAEGNDKCPPPAMPPCPHKAYQGRRKETSGDAHCVAELGMTAWWLWRGGETGPHVSLHQLTECHSFKKVFIYF